MKTVLFDLDGTLLPMDQDTFIRAYFGGLAKKMAPHGYDPETLIRGIWLGTASMVNNDGTQTNEDAFWRGFGSIFDRNPRMDEAIFNEFYDQDFPKLSQSCGFNPDAARLIRLLKSRGCRLVLATNPIFPAAATRNRIRWAGLSWEDFSLVTTYENSRHCKPNIAYYQDILDSIGQQAENCIMVGNDVTEDMVARELGMDVFLLTDCLINKDSRDIHCYPHGDFEALTEYLLTKTESGL